MEIRELRLVLGDQLNMNHSWFNTVDSSVCYVLMEVKSESEYVTHHIQKVIAFFSAMRAFSEKMKSRGHQFIYLKINASFCLTFIING
jgi:deoxyribodipyrimidine photolyase-related protein